MMDPLDERLARAGEAWRAQQPPVSTPAVVPARSGLLRSLVPIVGFVAGGLALVAVLSVVIPNRGTDVGRRLASPAPGRVPITLAVADTDPTFCSAVGHAGRLARDRTSGLGLVGLDGAAQPIRWPAGYTAFEAQGHAVLVDAGGAPVAIEGDPVSMGDAGWGSGLLLACDPGLASPYLWGSGGRTLAELVADPGADQVGAIIAGGGWLRLDRSGCPGQGAAASAAPSADGCAAVVLADWPYPPDPGDHPAGMLRVQDEAWAAFGAIPGLAAELPRYDIWKLERVDPAGGHEWQLLGRLVDSLAAPSPGSMATVHIVEHEGGGAIYMEGYRQTVLVDGPTGQVLAHERQPFTDHGSFGWPPGRYTVTTWVEPCDGSCEELDPPTDRCAATLDLAAGDRLTIGIARRAGEPCAIETAPY
jgi:hypothetical protein